MPHLLVVWGYDYQDVVYWKSQQGYLLCTSVSIVLASLASQIYISTGSIGQSYSGNGKEQ
jgi:hypothetical protein